MIERLAGQSVRLLAQGKTIGIVGTGLIGGVVAEIMAGFGCRVIAHDSALNPACRRWACTI